MNAILPWLQLIAGALLFLTLVTALWMLSINNRRPIGRTVGAPSHIHRSPIFLIVATLIFIGINILLWIPLPFVLPQVIGNILCVVGFVILCCGLAGYLWGMMVLGRAFTSASAFSASVFKKQALLTQAPFSFVRHPMYLSLQITALGGLLLYWNWSMVFLLACFSFLFIRARQEEKVLKNTFGEKWDEYSRKVPFWFPRLWR